MFDITRIDKIYRPSGDPAYRTESKTMYTGLTRDAADRFLDSQTAKGGMPGLRNGLTVTVHYGSGNRTYWIAEEATTA